MAGAIVDITPDNFQAEVLESEQPVLVDFWAPWCGPCRVIAPHLEALNEERSDLRVVKLNTEDNQELAARYGVLQIPTLILFKHGEESIRIRGAKPKRAIESELEPALA